jgi:DNA polymerase-3 subunit epsilon
MRSRIITLFDLELTGLDPVRHEIIEIGALFLDQPTLTIRDKFEAKIIPAHIETADPEALKINGYRPETWVDARPAREVLAEFVDLGKGSILSGQNVAFDFAFLRKALSEEGLPFNFHHHILDVMSMAFIKWYDHPTLKRFGLTEMTETFGIDRGVAHRAMADVEATYGVLKQLWPGFSSQ